MVVELDEAVDIAQSQLADFLGIPVPRPVAARAKSDARYLSYLIATRSNPPWLLALFERAEPEAIGESSRGEEAHLARLSARYLKSIGRSVASPFASIGEDAIRRRWEACLRCEHLRDAPATPAYHLGRMIIPGARKDNRICGLCGCFAHAKARKPTERCPAGDPADPSLSRWGEVRGEPPG